MESGCLLTIVMPCRNAHPGFLEEALFSVRGQTSPVWRLLVVDDGIDDPATLGALGKLRSDSRVSIIKNEGRHLTAANNTAMRAATTPWVCVLHADDLLADSAVEVLHRAIEAHPDVDYFHSGRRFIDERGRHLSGVYPAVEDVQLEDFLEMSPVKALHCWRVDVALAIGGMDESLGLHAGDDYDFPWRMARAGCRFRAVQECLYLIRDHREHERLTTHVPLDVQLNHLRAILAKNGVCPEEIETRLEGRTYMRQALYANVADRDEKERSGFDPRTGWREPYE